MNTSAIALRQLRKRFGPVAAVDGIDLEVSPGEFFSLVGPSGCGKTTLLRLIAGFEQPDEGELHIDGAPMNSVPPQRRPVNTVFQNYALFPHLSVFENVAFGLRVRRAMNLSQRVNAALDMLHVAELRDRYPSQISGGQKQRVALARALVVEPKVLLLDEPLAAVDAQRRAQVQEDLKALQRQSRTTFLYVTHDQDEALSLSDRIAVMHGGKVAQMGRPADVYERPRNRFVASFLGRCNLLSGSIVESGPNTAKVRTDAGTFEVKDRHSGAGNVTLAIRAERVQLHSSAVENSLAAEVTNVSYTGALTEFSLKSSSLSFRALSPGAVPLNPGDRVKAHFPPEALFFLEE